MMQRFIQDPLKELKDLFHTHEGAVSIALIFVLILLGFWYNSYQKNQQRKPVLSIDAADVKELSVGRTQQLYAFLDSDGNVWEYGWITQPNGQDYWGWRNSGHP